MLPTVRPKLLVRFCIDLINGLIELCISLLFIHMLKLIGYGLKYPKCFRGPENYHWHWEATILKQPENYAWPWKASLSRKPENYTWHLKAAILKDSENLPLALRSSDLERVWNLHLPLRIIDLENEAREPLIFALLTHLETNVLLESCKKAHPYRL